MLERLNASAIISVVAGLGMIIWGGMGVSRRYSDLFSIGLVFFGVGSILFGFTNGFSDATPRGRFLFKIGVLGFVIGIMALGYYYSRGF